MKAEPDLSIVVCAYNMDRELPRTLLTLSALYQRDVEGIEWDVIVLDNGSKTPVNEAKLKAQYPNLRVVRPEAPRQSPAAALNAVMAEAKGKVIGLWIDGARLASPGVIARAMEAWRADPTKVIGTLAFHLGPDVQMRTVMEGYDAQTEDALLASVPWRKDGYRLFDISVLAGSSAPGWFGCINESNGVFADRAFWKRLGGLDERFVSPGGGLVNLDLWQRAVAASDDAPWMILGEGTFHQVHGGVATNGDAEARAAFHAEYAQIHGAPSKKPVYRPRFVGRLDARSYRSGAARKLDQARQVQSVRGRHFRVGIEGEALTRIQAGTLRTRYKGLRLAKNPFDLVLYMRVLQALRPATIIEIGTSEGGSACWLIDQCKALGLDDTRLISVDIAPPDLELPGVSFHQGDAGDPGGTFPTDAIRDAPHPWLVIEDSAHLYQTTAATLDYLDRLMQPGDRIVVEDGVVADLEARTYREYEDGPNRAVAEFLGRTGQRYRIDAETCDFFGPNVTYAPNAWLIREA